jgi:hypothetical protein
MSLPPFLWMWLLLIQTALINTERIIHIEYKGILKQRLSAGSLMPSADKPGTAVRLQQTSEALSQRAHWCMPAYEVMLSWKHLTGYILLHSCLIDNGCLLLSIAVITARLVLFQNAEVNACTDYPCSHDVTLNSQAQATCTDIIGGDNTEEGRSCTCPSGLFYEESVGCISPNSGTYPPAILVRIWHMNDQWVSERVNVICFNCNAIALWPCPASVV